MLRRVAPLGWLAPALLCGVGIAGCSGEQDQVVLEFPSTTAIAQTSVISVSVFEPILRAPESDDLQFVTCDEVSTFPPMQVVDPETIGLSNLLGRVLRERESETYPLTGDFSVSFEPPPVDNANNPWGAVMVFIEARGDAREAARGAGQVAATLLDGCYCIRTRDGGLSDPDQRRLDQMVRNACPRLDEMAVERRIALEPVAPPEFKLTACDGVTALTAPKNGVLMPGPRVCLDAPSCDDVVGTNDCFKCRTPGCGELGDKSNAPILFTVEQAGGGAGPDSQVVLTDGEGAASAAIQVDDCQQDITVRAELLGREAEPVTFTVQCVEPVARFACSAERTLAPGFEAIDITTVPAAAGACDPGIPGSCDQIAVVYSNGTDSLLEVRSPGLVDPVRVEFPELIAHAVHGYLYDEGAAAEPVVAVALSQNRSAQVRVYAWRDGQLVPHDGAEGRVGGACAWLQTCYSGVECTLAEGCANMRETCIDGICQLASPCPPQIQLQSRVTLTSRDLDRDGRADLALGNSGELGVSFFYTRTATTSLYARPDCVCGRFGQSPNAFALTNLGGAVPDPDVSDIVVGSAGGTFVKYASAMAGGNRLTCGQSSPLGDGMSVRDVKSASLQCRPGDLSCVGYGDAIIVSARGISGGSLDEPGFIRLLYGSSTDLSAPGDVLDTPGVSQALVPASLPDRGEPRDPRRARLSDFNADGHQDLAVLYKASEEVHVWLGASNRTLGEVENGVVLEDCSVSLVPGSRCSPLPSFATPDLDGDGRAEIAVVCDPTGSQPRVRYFEVGGAP